MEKQYMNTYVTCAATSIGSIESGITNTVQKIGAISCKEGKLLPLSRETPENSSGTQLVDSCNPLDFCEVIWGLILPPMNAK